MGQKLLATRGHVKILARPCPPGPPGGCRDKAVSGEAAPRGPRQPLCEGGWQTVPGMSRRGQRPPGAVKAEGQAGVAGGHKAPDGLDPRTAQRCLHSPQAYTRAATQGDRRGGQPFAEGPRGLKKGQLVTTEVSSSVMGSVAPSLAIFPPSFGGKICITSN